MKKQLFSLALWMFFGFVLVNAIHSVLRFIVNIYFYIGIWLELSTRFLNYSIPVLSIIIYILISFLGIKYLNLKSINFELSEIKFPKISYIIAAIIAIFLNPLGNKLSGSVGENIASMESNYTASEFLSLYGITQASIGVSSWISIIILSIYFYRIYKKSEIEIEQ